LPGITAPALVIAGRQDGMYPLAQMEAAAASLPRGRLVVLETHHISAVDAPDATRQAVDAFLATLPP
jgi:3-oxoadipate enol-lactonase